LNQINFIIAYDIAYDIGDIGDIQGDRRWPQASCPANSNP
jgi:hypothetical protein